MLRWLLRWQTNYSHNCPIYLCPYSLTRFRLHKNTVQLGGNARIQKRQSSNNHQPRPLHLNQPVEKGCSNKAKLGVLLLCGAGISKLVYDLNQDKCDTGLHPFNPPRFTPFEIVKREEVSSTSILLTLRPTEVSWTKETDPYKSSWERGAWSVEVKQPELQIARSYTPLHSDDVENPADLLFLIRKEKKGEVSGYLHNRPLNGKVELRGPNPEVDLPEQVQEVIFLAGGTGISPALQVVYTLLERRSTEPKPNIHIIWANRKREDCRLGGDKSAPQAQEPVGVMVRMLQDLQQKHQGNLEVTYLVDEENTYIDQKRIIQAMKMGPGEKSRPVSGQVDSKLLFVSGPEGFIKYNAGPKRWEEGKEQQGELGGILGCMGLRDWKVWKL